MTEHVPAIHAFPASRRFSEIRQAALTIRDLDAESTLVWWKRLTRSMADQMLATGIAEAEVSQEIMTFQTAVFSELGRLCHEAAPAS